jgi:hypothetical protein
MAAEMRRPRGLVGARVLVVLASLLLIASILATWIRAQIIDTEGWTQTSVRLLRNSEVREVVANALSERVLAVIDTQGLAKEHLPPALAPLSSVLSTAADQAVPLAIDRALQAPAVQGLWASTNRLAHAQVIKLLNGGSSTLSSTGGVVAIDLGALVNQIGSRLGVGAKIGERIPPARRRLVLFRSNQLRLAQNAVKALRDLSFVLPLLALLLYIGALGLAAGRRPRMLLEIGTGIVAASLVAIVLRRWIESYVVDNLVHSEGVRPAIHEVIEIATQGWQSRALWLLATGVVVMLAGAVAGPTRWAVRLRALLADPLEAHTGWFAAGAVGLILVLAALGPTRTPGQALPLLLELVLAVLGVFALRRQIGAERLRAGAEAAATPAEGPTSAS